MENENPSRELASALSSAFPEYVSDRLAAIGIVAGNTVVGSIDEAGVVLETMLNELAMLPTGEQRRSPLELVREALAPITEALFELGVRSQVRDEWEMEQLADDPYALFPATSRDLGEEVWQLHIEWGIAKAREISGVVPSDSVLVQLPAVALFGVPIEDRQEVVDAVAERGYRALLWRNPAAVTNDAESPELAIIEAGHPAAHQALRDLEARGIRCIVVGRQVNDLAMPGFMALGAEEVIESRRLLTRLDDLLPRIV